MNRQFLWLTAQKLVERQLPVIAGPCAVESTEQIVTIAQSRSKKLAQVSLEAVPLNRERVPIVSKAMAKTALKMLKDAKDRNRTRYCYGSYDTA